MKLDESRHVQQRKSTTRMPPPSPFHETQSETSANSNANESENENEKSKGDDETKKIHGNLMMGRRPASTWTRNVTVVVGTTGIVVIFLLALGGIVQKHSSESNAWWCLLGMLLMPPLFLFAHPILVPSNTTDRRRRRRGGGGGGGGGDPTIHRRMIALASASAIVGNQFPRPLAIVCVSVSLALFGLLTRPESASSAVVKFKNENSKQNEHKHGHEDTTSSSPSKGGRSSMFRQHQLKPFIAALCMACSLLIENMFVWVASATYRPSHDGSPEPLQDNGRIVQTFLLEDMLRLPRRSVVRMRALLNVQWVLVASFATSVAMLDLGLVERDDDIDTDTETDTAEDDDDTDTENERKTNRRRRRRTIWTVVLRVILTLTFARIIRTVSFLLTVLPSQNPQCYRQRFPNPPPEDWKSWIMVGLTPMSHGGCNDLIISGHATITSSLACLSTSVAGNPPFSAALWYLLAIDFAFEVYEGFHYSVDMWMGALITCFIWRILAPLEDADDDPHSSTDAEDRRAFVPLSDATGRDLIKYAVPPLVVYVAAVVTPEAVANYWIFGSVAFIVASLLVGQSTHYIKHMLFSLLFLGFCIYL